MNTLRLVFLFLITAVGSSYAQFTVEGELKKWHKITITFDGPSTSETASTNPFTDYRLNVTFSKGNRTFIVPGYYAADGDAANSSADSGNKWRVHFAPDEAGEWSFEASFRTGNNVAMNDSGNAGNPISFDGTTGTFSVGQTDKTGRDHRGKGRLQYVGERYLKFAETEEYFLKIGADAPENFLAYEDFDNTPNNGNRRKSWGPHVQDWNNGDPTWQNNKGKGIIGALNYLAAEGQNVFSFLPMNIAGDDKNVFPYISDNGNDRLRMDCSKLDQWEIVFEHADKLGLYLHFKTQETENDQLLDDGNLGNERRLYYRELIARYSHHLALNWNIGEENTNTLQQRRDFAQYFRDHDPYQHLIVIHTFPGQHDDVYSDLVGNQSEYTGASLQVGWNGVHQRTLQWINNAANAGKQWVVANDEQGNANTGVPHDDYNGNPSQDGIRQAVLWGNLMAGGAGVEYYFGYNLPHSDLTCEDFRSRDMMWDYNRYAHQFFTTHVNFWEMDNHNELINNNNDSNDKYCLAKPGDTYVVYVAEGGGTGLDLGSVVGTFSVAWFNPRTGGSLQNGTVASVNGPGEVDLGDPPNSNNEDWVILVVAGEIECPDAGAPCDDGDPTTTDDVEDGECNCMGTPCPEAGTVCDDGNPATENDLEDGFCNCLGSIPGDSTNIWLEAECGIVGSNWSIQEDGNASNGEFTLPPNDESLNDPPVSAANMVIFNISVAQAGTYKIFARTITTADGDDSFWVRANEGNWVRWNKINFGNYGPEYQWEQVGNWESGDSNDPVTFELDAGINTIEFGRREPNCRLDKIYITLDQPLPDGAGALATNCEVFTSAEDVEFSQQLKLFPNPVKESFFLEIPRVHDDIVVNIRDMSGQLVQQRVLSGDGFTSLFEITSKQLAAGVYQVSLEINGQVYHSKFVKI